MITIIKPGMQMSIQDQGRTGASRREGRGRVGEGAGDDEGGAEEGKRMRFGGSNTANHDISPHGTLARGERGGEG